MVARANSHDDSPPLHYADYANKSLDTPFADLPVMTQAFPEPAAPRALLVVAAALVDVHGRILMQQRPPGREHAGLWEFPGGKLERGEGPVAALIRELHEELAIAVAPADCVALGFAATHDQAGVRPVILLLYGCCTWRGDPVSQEGAALAWVDAPGLSELALPPLDVPLIGPALAFAAAFAANR
jgi:8-oxo-dGTP diphosphatase